MKPKTSFRIFRISGKLTLAKSNVVLRGEGDATVIKATGTTQRTLLTLGKSTGRKDGVAIKDLTV